MKHFFLINIFLIAALAFLLSITSGNSIKENFMGEACRYNGGCIAPEKCVGGRCTPNYISTTNFTCRGDSDCTASQWCYFGSCNTKPSPSDMPAPPFPANNDPTWLLTRPNNRNFCPGNKESGTQFCRPNRPYCIYGPVLSNPNNSNSGYIYRYLCSYYPS